MNKLILMRGISGSGKSTLAQLLVDNGVVFSTDDYFTVDGQYVFDPAKLGHYHGLNVARTEKAMIDDVSPIVIDNTNLVFRDMKPYLELAKSYGYAIEVCQIDTDDIEVLLERQSKRKDANKALPREVLERMKGKFDKDWQKLLKDYL